MKKSKCETCLVLEVELGLAKNKVHELTELSKDYSARWAAMNSELESLRCWKAGVLTAAGLEERK